MAAATLVKLTPIKNQYLQKALYFRSAVANALDNSGLQDIFEVDLEGCARVCCEITVATNALAAFAIKALFHPEDTTWSTIRSTQAQFLTPTGILVDTSGDLTTQAPGQGWFVLDCAGLSKIRIAANSSNAGGSTLAVFGGGL